MSFFGWTAPLFKLSRHRWSEDDFRVIAEHLRPYVHPNGLVLDLGGGTGDLGLGVGRELGAEVIVADVTPEMLRRVSPHPSISVRLTAAEALPFPDGHFDALLCSDAFHHFRDQEAAAREMARVVRPGGGVLVFEFRRTGLGRPLVFAGAAARRAGLFHGTTRVAETPLALGDQRYDHRQRRAHLQLRRLQRGSGREGVVSRAGPPSRRRWGSGRVAYRTATKTLSMSLVGPNQTASAIRQGPARASSGSSSSAPTIST